MKRGVLTPALLLVAAALFGGAGHARADVACGPNAFTYQVGGDAADLGVRCLRFVDPGSFVWYGEGRAGEDRYRRLGYATWSGSSKPGTEDFRGWAGDITGNGETTAAAYPGDLKLSVMVAEGWTPEAGPPRTVEVSGALTEVWTLVERVQGLAPLPAVRRCGPNFRQYAASRAGATDTVRLRKAAIGAGESAGVRCLLDADGKFPAAWYGEGRRDGAAYRHIGSAWFGVLGPAWGAGELCMDAAASGACGHTAFGDLRFERFDHEDVYRVQGDWSEWWDRARP